MLFWFDWCGKDETHPESESMKTLYFAVQGSQYICNTKLSMTPLRD